VRIPYDRTAERVAALLARKMETLPEVMRNSVTWDQGKEMANTRTLRFARACLSTSVILCATRRRIVSPAESGELEECSWA